MTNLSHISGSNRPLQSQPSSAFALWNLGFRPFYLLASVFSVLAVLVWAAQYSGYLPATAYLQGPLWHGHEMLFGYTLAVVAGFLLTAVRAWTGQPTASGLPLVALALLWLAGRVLVLTPYAMAAALVNAAFPAAVALAIGIPLVRGDNRRNYFFVGLLLLMSAMILILHLAYQGWLKIPPRMGLQVGLDIMLFIMAVIGGRVIPMFTNNGVPGIQAARHPVVEKLALGSALLLLLADLLQLPAAIIIPIAAMCALAHALRLYLWQPWRTLAVPLVWILHAGYAWIVVHLVLRALAAGGWVPESLALHALTLGAIGGLTIGMMTRTARGHTGRPLKADRYEIACYLLIQLAAVMRVFVAMALPDAYLATVIAASIFWSTAFALYAIRYWPILSRPRLDGKPG